MAPYFILEVAFLFGGGYALITGKVPTFLHGGPRYEITGTPARLLGFVMLFPLPLSFLVSIVLTLVAQPAQARAYGTAFEIGFTLFVAVIVLIVMQRVRKLRMTVDGEGNQVELVSSTEELIARKVNGSLVYLILGGLGLAGFILGPLAWWRGKQALALIDEHHIGEQYRGRARFVQALGLIVAGFWILAPGAILLFIMMGSVYQR